MLIIILIKLYLLYLIFVVVFKIVFKLSPTFRKFIKTRQGDFTPSYLNNIVNSDDNYWISKNGLCYPKSEYSKQEVNDIINGYKYRTYYDNVKRSDDK